MSTTPLYTALCHYLSEQPLRMHMPGHKGILLPLPDHPDIAALDVTELPPTGDLYAGGGALGQAQALWAEAFHMPQGFFLTGGSTQGLHTALALTCKPGDAILLDRCSHRAVHNAISLLDLTPVYLPRPWLSRYGVPGPVSATDLEKCLIKHPNVKTCCITSPTYYGILSDIPAISATLHRYGMPLIVDAAHGAHLPFLGDYSLSTADLVVASAHKTLPALGQTALIFASEAFPHATIRRVASLYGTSSPSYLLMASLDCARAYMLAEGAAQYQRIAGETARLRAAYPSIKEMPLDPARLVLLSKNGYASAERLAEQGVYVEMADQGHLVFILTCADGRAELKRLESALDTLGLSEGPSQLPPPPPLPEQVLSPRTALFSRRRSIPLHLAEGEISAVQVAPYPPGVPIIAPGERIDKKTIAYLAHIGYNMEESIEVVLP